MAILDAILSILKGANPEADDATLQAHAAQLASHPDASSVMSPFDVQTSDNTVTQNGNLPTATPPMMPVKLGLSDMATPENLDISKLPAPEATPAPAPEATPVAPPVATAVPSQPAPSKTIAPAAVETPVGPSDNDKRQAMLEAANKKAKMASIPAAIAGVGGAIGNAAQVFGVHPESGAEERILNRAQENLKTNKAGIESEISNDPNSEASKSARSLVLQIAPQMAQQPGFNQMSDAELRNKLPLVDTMMKAKSAEDMKKIAMAQAKSNRDISLGLREDQQQDKLEGQAMQRLSTLRGDQSLARIENQRDAAISAYSLLQQAKNEGRALTQPEYYDLLGQLWKARSGAAPTQEAMRDLDAKTFQGSLNKAATYFTGKPAGATTQSALDNLQQFTRHTGELMDTEHESYMAPHLIKPNGLHEDRWNPIKNTARGISFATAVKNASKSGTEGGRKTAGGYSYTVQP